MGGVNCLLASLDVDSATGLHIGAKRSGSEDAPAMVITAPGGEKAKAEGRSTHDGAAYTSTVEDRKGFMAQTFSLFGGVSHCWS